MPLFADGLKRIRRSLERVAAGQPSWYEKVGKLSPDELTVINTIRAAEGHPPISGRIVCNGKHLYDSRCVKDGYSIDEVIAQTEMAFNLATRPAREGWATLLKSEQQPPNAAGYRITYEIVFECSSKHPDASLFSVIPRGDGRSPGKKPNPLDEGVLAQP